MFEFDLNHTACGFSVVRSYYDILHRPLKQILTALRLARLGRFDKLQLRKVLIKLIIRPSNGRVDGSNPVPAHKTIWISNCSKAACSVIAWRPPKQTNWV